VPEDKLTELYRTYGPVVYARCRRILGDAAAAEDATQETFLRVQRHLEKAPNGREALIWIHRIATNYCLTEVRNAQHRPESVGELPELASGSPEQVLADRDLARRLIAACPPKVRPAAYLCHVDGMGQAEAAELLGVSRRTGVSRLTEFQEFVRSFLERVRS